MNKLTILICLLLINSIGLSQTNMCNQTTYKISVKDRPLDYAAVLRTIEASECIDVDTSRVENGFYHLYNGEGWIRRDLLDTQMMSAEPELPPICESCIVEKDKFTNKVSYRFPFDNHIRLSKVEGVRYLSLTAYSGHCTVSFDEHDVVFLFEDGTTHTIQEKYDTETTASGFSYSVFIRVDDRLAALLKTKKLTDYRIYIYDVSLNSKKSNKVTTQANCIF